MATVTSLYICSSYIYTYFYNFNSFSSYIPIACQYFSITCSMSLTHPLSILFLYSYLYTLPIPILVMCSSFTLIICLLNVPFSFSSYIPCLYSMSFSFVGSMIYYILCTITHIISFLIYHIYFAYFLSLAYIVYLIYFIVFLVSCSLQVSYTFMSRILSYNLSYTIMYVYLHSYTFHIW